MKKTLIFALAILISAPILTACAPSSNYKELGTKVTEFLTSETYTTLASENLSYSSKINTAIINNPDFAVLDTYEKLASYTFVIAEETYASFSIAPLNKAKSSGTTCGKVVKALDAVQNQFEDFLSAKNSFVANIENLDINGNGAKAELSVFKIEFGKMIVKLNNFNVAYENAYTALYGGVKSEATTSTQVKNATICVYADLLDDYIDYSIKEFDYAYTTISQNFVTDFYNLKSNIQNTVAKTTSYAVWFDFYELFKNEHKIFATSLDNVNLKSNKTLSGKKKIYKTNVENYITSTASLFMQKTSQLLF